MEGDDKHVRVLLREYEFVDSKGLETPPRDIDDFEIKRAFMLPKDVILCLMSCYDS